MEPFSDMYAAIGWQPQQRRLLQLLANATASASSGGMDAAALAAALLGAANGDSWAGAVPTGLGGNHSGSHGGRSGGGDGSGPVDISWLGLLLGALVIGINGAISVWLRLGLHGKLAVATVRCAPGAACGVLVQAAHAALSLQSASAAAYLASSLASLLACAASMRPSYPPHARARHSLRSPCPSATHSCTAGALRS